MYRRLLLVCLLAAQGCSKAKDADDPVAAPDAVVTQFQDGSARLRTSFLDAGTWVCTRPAEGTSCEHAGEAILWSGVALATLSCADGQSIEAGLIDMIMRGGGALVRVEPLGEYKGGREITVDGALGLYRGIAHRLVACAGSADRWRPAIQAHYDYVATHDGHLNEAAPAKLSDSFAGITVGFAYVLDLIAARVGVRGEPDSARAKTLAVEVAAWVLPGNLKHVPAYRNNLSLLAIQTVEELGADVSDGGRNAFCQNTRGVQLPTVDHYCGVGDIKDWAAGFVPDQYEYRHQRSGSWEEPDGDGMRTPGLDLLVGLRQGYTLPELQAVAE